MTNKLTRRCFLKTAAATSLLAPSFVPKTVLGGDGQLPASDRITIAMFGVGNRGMQSLRCMWPLPDHQVIAIADCRKKRREHAGNWVNDGYAKRTGMADYKGCDLYNDFEEVLARDDIDAVWGCVPDHWHGVLCDRIIRSGKDLYGEKPVTRYIAEGQHVQKLVREYGIVFQTGTQQRSDWKFRHACNLATNGYLGKVHTIEVGAPGGMAYPAAPPCKIPEGFDYERWTGPAPMIPFDSQRCEWLAMYMISHYGAGFITNWGVHHLDIAGWGIPEVFEKPFTIEGTGTMPTEGITDTWIDWQCHLNWESGLKMHYTNSDNPVKKGCRFIGDEGWVWVNRRGIHASSPSILEVRLGPNDKPLHESPNCGDQAGYTSHTADFFRSIRTRQDPVSPVEAGHAASTLGNVSDIALRLGRKLTWDPTAGQFVGDADANTMLMRTHRSPWTI
jgi:predicted dehydrogenase